MKQVAYTLSKTLFYIYSTLYLFVMIFSILSYFEYKYGVQIPFVEVVENRPKINVPLLGLRINVPLNYSILIMWSVMSYYAIYFYAFMEFLKVFVEKNMFEAKSLERLRLFLILNVTPLAYIFMLLISGEAFRLEDDHFIVLAHLVIAFLIYLYLDALKKGRSIQEENDLTI